ncbi:phosphatidylinositol N-acetylglucosaminyltransferase Gpi2p subunit [Trichomonascus vanleenenianus]|uniref:phosphatidylinositol N-acetylglucosaminyltransferase n=1 Tax=Trichomonascus vanleenenianus TaxID=2268995 RepID=UPI003ECA41DF
MEDDLVPWPSKPEEKPWRKLLWVDQPYPDNYVDESFLSQLKRNSNVQQYLFWDLVTDSSVILLHLSTIVVFGTTFLGIYDRGWDPAWVATASSGVTVMGFVVYDTVQKHSRDRIVQLKSACLILFTILALSPVLKSLTQSTSSDSIWALACWLCLANVCFHDYSFFPRKQFRPMLSTNLALCAAIVLASRLPTTLSVFYFVLYSIELFGVFPTFALWVRQTSRACHWVLLAVCLGLADAGVYSIGGLGLLSVWVLTQAAVAFVFPSLLRSLQKYKNEIQGPWDPAKPVINWRRTQA